MWRQIWNDMQNAVGPRHFYEIAGRWLPWFLYPACLFMTVGLVWGLAFAPVDYQQGNSYRIMFVHVPAASLAMTAYLSMAVFALIFWVWRVKTAEILLQATASVGAWFCFIALVTGAIWGKPTWGTYWVWDARLTSMLILWFLYLGILALYSAYENAADAGKAAALLAMVGVVNLPIIKYSVEWWNTLHQGSSFKLTAKPTMPPEMYLPLLMLFLGFYCLCACLVIWRARNMVLWRERRSQWVYDTIKKDSGVV
jgi:heme exporter protein C